MEIIIAMVLTIIKIVYYVIQIAVAAGVVGLILIVVGVGGIFHKRWEDWREQKTHDALLQAEKDKRRSEKEVSANGDYFEGFSVPVVGGSKLYVAPISQAQDSEQYWREIDRLNDEKILENTKDL